MESTCILYNIVIVFEISNLELILFSGVFRLPSDDALNADSETHGGFLAFAVCQVETVSGLVSNCCDSPQLLVKRSGTLSTPKHSSE